MKPSARIYVAGSETLAGAALVERLRSAGYRNLVGTGDAGPDLTVAGQVEDFFGEARPQYVFLVAGKSGGIWLNQERPAELMLDNLQIAIHVIQQAYCQGVRKLLYLASSCGYPTTASQPSAVEALLTGPLEATSAAYALAKLAGWKLCEAYRQQYGVRFITAFPTNSFGPNDDFSPEGAHVIPGLLRRAHEAKQRGDPELTVWGTGMPRREFLYAQDLADACLFLMRRYEGSEPINIGGDTELSIAEIARAVADTVGYPGRIRFDLSKPDGAPLKGLDWRPLRDMGWRPATDFRTALTETYTWFLQHGPLEENITDVRTAV